jgi:hypothetical protein
MKPDTDPFPVGVVELMNKKVLVCTDQAEMTKGKNVVISDELRNRMIKTHNPEIGVWKENVPRKSTKRVKPTSAMLRSTAVGGRPEVPGNPRDLTGHIL